MRLHRLRLVPLLLLLAASWLLSPTLAHSRNVNLAWDRSASDVGNGTYKIYWGNGSGSYASVAEAGNTTQTRIENLADELNWYFAATYADSRGESGYSNEVSVLAEQQQIASATNVIVNWQQVQELPMAALVQAKSTYSPGQVQTLGLAFDSAVTAGNFVVALTVAYGVGSNTAFGVTYSGSGGGSFTNDTPSGNAYRGLHSLLNAPGDLETITFDYDTGGTTASYLGLIIAEFSGVATASAFDSDTDAFGSETNTAHSATIAASTDEACLIIAGARDSTNNITRVAAGDSTLAADLDANGYQGGVMVYEIQSGAGSATLDWTSSSSEVNYWVIAGYRLAEESGGISIPVAMNAYKQFWR